MIEVEMKFVLTEPAQVLEKLESLPDLRFIKEETQIDQYYDTPDFACFRQAVFLRLRNRQMLEFKYHDSDDPEHLHVVEQQFPLTADSSRVALLNQLGRRFIDRWIYIDTVEEALSRNRLQEFVRIEKKRVCYTARDVSLALDFVEGLGHFLEIECSCAAEAAVALAERRLHEIRAALGLTEVQLVRTGYVELWLQRYEPALY